MPGANFAHDARWAGVGNRVMSMPISAMMTAAAVGPIAGDLVEPGDRVSERGQMLPIWVSTAAMSAFDGVDPGQHPGQQEPVMVVEGAQPQPGERFLQERDLGPHPGPGQLGQHLGVAFPGDQRGHHRPPGDAEDVRGHDRQLQAGVLQQLLHPVLLRGADPDQIDPVPGQVPQPADVAGRHEAGPQHLPLGDLAQPHRVQPVGLGPARQMLDVFGVDQPRLQTVRLEQVERRPPIVAGRLHHHPFDPQPDQPVRQLRQRAHHRGIGGH